jgi:subtilisin family serine protease
MSMQAAFRLMWVAVAFALTLGAAHAGDPARIISGQYIVVLDKARLGTTPVANAAQRLVARVGGGDVIQVYDTALTGFAVRIPAVAAQALKANPLVRYIEADSLMRAVDTQTNPPSYGLDRVDQAALPLSGSYTYPSNAGAGVHVYDIDTGLRATHVDFAGRTGAGRNFAPNTAGSVLCQLFGVNCPAPNPADTGDCNGHGTHTAGTAVGTSYGVAKKATIHAVRVLGCNGSGATSGVIGGVDWVAANRVLPAVANMSLGGSASQALDDSIRNLINRGVSVAIAAGNDSGADACGVSPARVTQAITVGASESNDARASYSNIGTCLDVFAPGTNIVSTWSTSDTATNTISGTSMATPHVTGAVARYLTSNPGATPAQVQTWLTSTATNGVVTNAGTGSPNKLLFLAPAGP